MAWAVPLSTSPCLSLSLTHSVTHTRFCLIRRQSRLPGLAQQQQQRTQRKTSTDAKEREECVSGSHVWLRHWRRRQQHYIRCESTTIEVIECGEYRTHSHRTPRTGHLVRPRAYPCTIVGVDLWQLNAVRSSGWWLCGRIKETPQFGAEVWHSRAQVSRSSSSPSSFPQKSQQNG